MEEGKYFVVGRMTVEYTVNQTQEIELEDSSTCKKGIIF